MVGKPWSKEEAEDAFFIFFNPLARPYLEQVKALRRKMVAQGKIVISLAQVWASEEFEKERGKAPLSS